MEYIYLIRIYGKDKTLVKLGYTSDIKARLAQYLYANPLYEVIQTYVVENALQFEQDFHNKYLASFGNEWYEEDLLPTMIKEIEAQVHEIYVSKPAPKLNFKNIVEECKKGDEDYLAWAYSRYDFLEEAINRLGYKGIEQCSYGVTNVRRKIGKLSTTDDRYMIYQYIVDNNLICEGNFYNFLTIKEIFETVYKELDMKLTPKSTDINTYFYTKTSDKKYKIETIELVDNIETKRIKWKSNGGYIISKAKL